MTNSHTSSRRSAGLVGTTCALLMVSTAVPAAAAPTAFEFVDSSYILTLRSGGIEPTVFIPRELATDVGHSYVDLIHDIGQEKGRCEVIGAGYWLGGELEEGVLGNGAAPPDAGDVSGGYRNPTIARDVQPNLSPGENQSAKDPGVKNYFPPGNELVDIPSNGNGPKWQAKCDSDAKGSATGDVVNVGGFQVVGSTAQAEVDKATGVYTGTSRAYVFGLEGASGFDSASSFMQVVNKPNAKPTITYRMSYFNFGDLEKTGKNGITFGGSEIPVEDFAKAFNDGAKTLAEAYKPVGTAGAGTLVPEVGTSIDNGRFTISISAGHVRLGVSAREGTAGGNQIGRVGSVTFTGVYGDN
jgi:hypothetical protein